MKTKQIFSAFTAFLTLFAVPGVSFAAEMSFIKEYTYQASEIDSKITSRAQALAQAKRLVLEEFGAYLMSGAEVKDFAVSSGKITTLTAGVVQTEIFDEDWTGKTYYLKARIKADPGTAAMAIDRLRKDEDKTSELEESKRRADAALREIEKLKAELDIAKDDGTWRLAYANKVNVLSAAEWFEKGMVFQNSGDFNDAADAYSKAVEFDPDYAEARNNLGAAHGDMGRYDTAIEDYNKAISLKPDFANAYYNRGNAHYNMGQYDAAIEDYSKAISLKPDFVFAYYYRGNTYYNNGQFDRGIEDYNKAISLKPDDADAYYNRGLAYRKKGQIGKAVADYKRSCELGDDDGCEQARFLNAGR